MDFQVVHKYMFACEGFPTITTLIGPLSSVNSLVYNECRMVPKAFPTFTALVGPLSSMTSLVSNECGAVPKAFPTFTALVGPLSSVTSLVSNEYGMVPKEFSTITANVRPFSRVDFLVTELGQCKESLPTLAAPKRPQLGVNSLLVIEARYLCKEYSIFRVLIKPCFGVDFLVLIKVGVSSLTTIPVLIRLFSGVDFLMVNKYMFTEEGVPAMSALVIVWPILKGLSTCSVPVWFPHTVGSLLLETAYAGCIPAPQGPLCHANSAVPHE